MEQRESPMKDPDGDITCDECYREKFEGECDRCGETVDETELAMNPGELLALWEEVDDLAPGYYRVLRWPIYMNGMITGHILKENLEYTYPLDKKGEEAAAHSWTPGGRLCKRCRDEIEDVLAAQK